MRSTHGSNAFVSKAPRCGQSRDWVRGDRYIIVLVPWPHRHPVRSRVRDSLPIDLPIVDCPGSAFVPRRILGPNCQRTRPSRSIGTKRRQQPVPCRQAKSDAAVRLRSIIKFSGTPARRPQSESACRRCSAQRSTFVQRSMSGWKQAYVSIGISLGDGAPNTMIGDHTMIGDRHHKHDPKKYDNAPIPGVRRIPIDR